MAQFLPKWLRTRPAVIVVALFAGLNLIMILLASLGVVSENAQGGQSPVLFQPTAAASRIVLAVGIYGAILFFLRSGAAKRWERIALVAFGVMVVALLTLFVSPLLSLAIIPFVARFWLSLQQTLVLAIGLFAWSMIWGLTFGRLEGVNPPIATLAIFGIIAVVFGGYALISFEFALREARAREELTALYDELARSHQQLKGYQELVIQRTYLEERGRISRELHDTLGHDLIAQRLDLEILKTSEADRMATKQALIRALDRNAEAMQNLRRAVRALRPESLESMSLSEALHHLVSASSTPHLVRLRLTGEEGALPPNLRVALYRAVQETLTNVTKHAPGRPLDLQLQFLSERIELKANNPADHRGCQEGGVGLQGLRERVENLSGTFEASYQDGRFNVWMSLPR